MIENKLINELRDYLDSQEITSDNIGNMRRQLFVPWHSEWNGIVRDETAARENKPLEILLNRKLSMLRIKEKL